MFITLCERYEMKFDNFYIYALELGQKRISFPIKSKDLQYLLLNRGKSLISTLISCIPSGVSKIFWYFHFRQRHTFLANFSKVPNYSGNVLGEDHDCLKVSVLSCPRYAGQVLKFTFTIYWWFFDLMCSCQWLYE